MAITSVKQVVTDTTTVLSGEFAYDGASLNAGDVVLVAREGGSADSGPRTVAAGDWTRHPDFDNIAEFAAGVSLLVREGNAHAGENFQLKNSPATLDASIQDWRPFGDTGEETTLSSYIEGCGLRYVSATQVALDPGAFFIPGLNRVVQVDSAITTTRLTGNNALYYAYGYEANGVGQFHLDDTPPAEPYFGSARTMDGDQNMRYLAMLRNSSAGDLMSFNMFMGGPAPFYLYAAHSQLSVFNIVVAATNTTSQTAQVGITATDATKRFVSPGAEMVYVVAVASGSRGEIGWPPGGAVVDPPVNVEQTKEAYYWIPVNSAQEFNYRVSVGTVNLSVDLAGYYERR